MNFSVSIVIPVYKAADYVRQAVESALKQPETFEVILIEDKSPDNSLEVCKQLVKEFPKVKLLQHPNGENRGAGASRNMGMLSAQAEFISFLDADDYFLENRFSQTQNVFREHPDAEGVYDAVVVAKEGEPQNDKLFSMKRSVPPAKLFHYLIRGTFGHFHTNGITFRKSLLEKTGLFNVNLRLHQDSELWLRFSYYGKLYAGKLNEPVTNVRRHDNNRITHANQKSRLQFWEETLNYWSTHQLKRLDYLLIVYKYCKVSAAVSNTSPFSEAMKLWKSDRSKITKLFSL